MYDANLTFIEIASSFFASDTLQKKKEIVLCSCSSHVLKKFVVKKYNSAKPKIQPKKKQQ